MPTMTFTADQYSQIAQGYEKAAADPLVTSEKRAELARKAQWFDFLAGRERKARRLSSSPQGNTDPIVDRDSKSAERPRRSMAPFLTTLWITGAGLYLLSTLLFTNAINLFGDDDRQQPLTEASQSIESLPKVASVEGNASAHQGDRQIIPAAERRHAISPDQPAYESPTLTAPSPLPQEELSSPPLSEPVQEVVGVESAEVFTVTATATIRNGPSTSAKKIGTATAGAELQVKAREKAWVQFVDPSSGNTGWIQSSLVAPASVRGGDSLAAPQAAEPQPVKPAKSRLAKKKPSAPAKVTQRSRTYAGLPADEEFLPPRRRGPGILNKRRMLGEGLMSPGFLPPE